jgi:hypothetical protein
MRMRQYINEKRKNNVIVVDIQPMYASYLNSRIDMGDFIEFIKEQGKILYYYNGPDTVGDDTKDDIIRWLYEKSDYDDELLDKLESRDVIWYDKGYAFFRAWMDEGADVSFIIKAIRWMAGRKIWDSREIEPEEWQEKFPNDWEDFMEDDMLNIPDIPLSILKSFSGAYLVGGGKDECLKEVEILMSAFNIRAKKVRDFIY